MRALFTAFLVVIGIGDVTALSYLFLVEIDPHRRMGMDAVQGVIHKYYGKRGTTKLESALRGSMGETISTSDRRKLLAWVHSGGKEESYPAVEPIIRENCAICHGDGGQLPRLTSFADVSGLTKQDLGESIRQLAEVSHVHLFGIAIIFMMSGAIFSLCELREWFKVVVVITPFVAMLLDISSWWLTHYETVFAYTVIAGGLLMSLSVPIQVIVSIYQMWFGRRSPANG